jgi:nicotinate phosphoribosyltransferase
MLQAFYHQYPNAVGRWEFKCRNEDVKLGPLVNQVREQIDMLADVRVTKADTDYLMGLGYFKQSFLKWFGTEFQLDPTLVSVGVKDGDLEIIAEGKLIDINIFEVYILSIVNELYFNSLVDPVIDQACGRTGGAPLLNYQIGMDRLDQKIKSLKDYPNLKFAEFGTRRRYSKRWQANVVSRLVSNCPNIVGTSNVHLAKKFNIKPIGTVAHEFSMAHLSFVDRLEQAQGRALHVWRQEYDQSLGIALSDTFTTDAFLRDFGFSVARAYDGVRHDSGCPFEFGHKMIEHYKSIGIDPRRKAIIFSDGLDIPLAIKIWKEFAGLISVSFGIGTNFSNDVGIKPLNIVMKLLECNGKPTIKLSDNVGKAMGDAKMIEMVKEAYKVV